MRTQTRRSYAVEFKQPCTTELWVLLREVADWLEAHPGMENDSFETLMIGYYGDEEGELFHKATLYLSVGLRPDAELDEQIESDRRI